MNPDAPVMNTRIGGTVSLPSRRMREIDEVLEQATTTGAVPGIAAVVVAPDGVLYEGSAGSLSVEDDRPVGQDTIFAIASMTKAMTSVAALQLVEQGTLDLDQTVESVIPAFGELQKLEGFDGDAPRLREPKAQPTIRQLMNHTSGLGYWFANEDLLRWYEQTGTPTPLSCERAAYETPLVHDPGERWEYGVSTDWLGLVVEQVTGQRLGDYLAAHVWGPLGMADSSFGPSEQQADRVMPVHARGEDGGLVLPDFQVPDDPEVLSGGGGAYSSPRDYGRFLRMLLRGGELDGAQVLEPATTELLFTDSLGGLPLPEVSPSAVPELTKPVPALPFKQGWGLGLALVLEDIPGMRRAGSGNWAGLFNCYFWVDRSSGIAAALMTSLLPFFDDQMVRTLLGFEAAVYAHLAAPAPA
jgi:CubicO group peptidase (beta-lactamase class C family)